jgi:hypothetical protein
LKVNVHARAGRVKDDRLKREGNRSGFEVTNGRRSELVFVGDGAKHAEELDASRWMFGGDIFRVAHGDSLLVGHVGGR